MNCWKIFKLIKYFKNYADFKKKKIIPITQLKEINFLLVSYVLFFFEKMKGISRDILDLLF